MFAKKKNFKKNKWMKELIENLKVSIFTNKIFIYFSHILIMLNSTIIWIKCSIYCLFSSINLFAECLTPILSWPTLGSVSRMLPSEFLVCVSISQSLFSLSHSFKIHELRYFSQISIWRYIWGTLTHTHHNLNRAKTLVKDLRVLNSLGSSTHSLWP